MIDEPGTGADRSVGETGLKPVLGYRHLVLFYLVVILSIRLVPGVAAIGPSSIVLWLVAFAVFFIPQALAVVDLSRRMPGEGGIYLWSKHAFGDFHGFLCAWIYWTSGIVYYPAVLLFTASQAAYIFPGTAHLADDRTFLTVFAILAMLLIFLLNYAGFDVATRFHDFSAYARFAIVALLLGLGAASWVRFGPATDMSPANWVPSLSNVDDLVFLAGIAYMLAGAESAATLGDEVKNPRRDIPRALVSGGILVTGLYVLATLALMIGIPADDLTGLQGFTDMVAASAGRLGGDAFATIATSAAAFLLSVMALGIVSGWFAIGARLPFVVGLDRYLPPIFGHVSRRFGSPDVSLATLALATIAFIVAANAGGSITQAYSVLISLEIVVFLLVYVYLFAAVLKLEARAGSGREPRSGRARRIAYTTGSVGLVVTSVLVVLALIPGDSVEDTTAFFATVLGSLALNLLTAVGLYGVARRRRSSTSPSEGPPVQTP